MPKLLAVLLFSVLATMVASFLLFVWGAAVSSLGPGWPTVMALIAFTVLFSFCGDRIQYFLCGVVAALLASLALVDVAGPHAFSAVVFIGLLLFILLFSINQMVQTSR